MADSVMVFLSLNIRFCAVSNENRAMAEDTITVRFLQAPNLSIAGDRNICEGQNVGLIATNGFDVYKWSTDTGVICANCRTLKTKPSTLSARYYLTATAENGCSISDTVQITVNPPSESFLDTLLCAGESLRIGNEFYRNSGTYKVRLPNSFGCDSIINLTLRHKSTVTPTATDATCYGKDDGRIFLHYDTAGVKLWINENISPFSSLNNLRSSDYHIRVAEKGFGCAIIDTTLRINQIYLPIPVKLEKFVSQTPRAQNVPREVFVCGLV